MTGSRTTLADRVRDAVALAFVVAGAALVLVSHAGMRRLATKPIDVPRGEYAIAQFDHYYYMELGGYAAATVGIVLGIASFVIHVRRQSAGVDTAPQG